MIRRLLDALSALTIASGAYASDLDRVVVNGTPVGVCKNAIDRDYVSYIVTVGDRVVSRSDNDSVSIEKVYEDGGNSFVVIVEQCGGTACGPRYRVLQIADNHATVTPLFGTGLPANSIMARGGSLVLIMETEDHKSLISYIAQDGKLQTLAEIASLETGPDVAPGGDLAAFMNGHTISEVFRMRAAVIALKRIMPAAVFDEVRQWALNWNNTAAAKGDYTYISKVCQPHACGNYLSVAFDHRGQAVAAVAHDNHWVFYGNPDGLGKLLLTR